MSERNRQAESLQPKGSGHDLPQAHKDFPDESRIWRLMDAGFTYDEACGLSPDESDRYLAVANGWRQPRAQQEPAKRKATQADIDAFFGRFGG